MTAAITWLVLWVLIFLAVPTVMGITFWLIGGIGAVKGKTEKSKTGAVLVGFFLALIGGGVLWVVSAINVIGQIVTIIQLL